MGKKKKSNFIAIVSGVAVGAAAAVCWPLKDKLTGAAKLINHENRWIKVSDQPLVYMTKEDMDSQQAFFDYLEEQGWRLVDQIADGYFWLNDQEEILLVTQTSVLAGKYINWQASRQFNQ